eukprot:TRINITY_DN12945_c0_g1_i1.p1 TRINITY_DN12945_c0_g1~~TRINITY_DN12945_c0_g1_i1.p1  ORF type:complete len:414 (+),score=79.57 TRINITY_DN12945_c0_g1_i1:147-1388(+)
MLPTSSYNRLSMRRQTPVDTDVVKRFTSRKQWVKRIITVIREKVVVYRLNGSKRVVNKREIPIAQILNVEVVGELGNSKHVFRIEGINQTMMLKSSTSELAKKWVKIIRKCIVNQRSETKRKLKEMTISRSKDDSVVKRKKSSLDSPSGGGAFMFRRSQFEVVKSVRAYEKIGILEKCKGSITFLVKHNMTKKKFCMKVFEKDSFDSEVIDELKQLGTLSHPFFLRVHHVFESNTKFYLILDYMKSNSLTYYLSLPYLDERSVQFYIGQLYLVLRYFHLQEYSCHNLSLDDVKIDEFGDIIITQLSSLKLTKQECFTQDWNNLGCIMDELLDSIRDKDEISEHAFHLRDYLLSDDISADEIKSHPFFMNLRWDKLEGKRLSPPFISQISACDDLDEISKSQCSSTRKIDIADL